MTCCEWHLMSQCGSRPGPTEEPRETKPQGSSGRRAGASCLSQTLPSHATTCIFWLLVLLRGVILLEPILKCQENPELGKLG